MDAARVKGLVLSSIGWSNELWGGVMSLSIHNTALMDTYMEKVVPTESSTRSVVLKSYKLKSCVPVLLL